MAEILSGAELSETSNIKVEESLKCIIDIGIILEEIKYGTAWARGWGKFIA